MQTREHYRTVAQPGMEPWGFYTCGDAAYMARADALQRMDWLPTYDSAGGHSLGIECKVFGTYVAYINECLVSGQPCCRTLACLGAAAAETPLQPFSCAAVALPACLQPVAHTALKARSTCVGSSHSEHPTQPLWPLHCLPHQRAPISRG